MFSCNLQFHALWDLFVFLVGMGVKKTQSSNRRFGFDFFVLWPINLCGLFNTEAILLEKLQ